MKYNSYPLLVFIAQFLQVKNTILELIMVTNCRDVLPHRSQNMIPGLGDIALLWRTGKNTVLGSTSVKLTQKFMVESSLHLDKSSRLKLESYSFGI